MLIEPELMKHFADSVTARKFPNRMVCGVDIYKTMDNSIETGDDIDLSQPYTAARNSDDRAYFFSSRRFEIVDLFDTERMNYCPCNDIEDVRRELNKKNRPPLLLLSASIEVSTDENEVYVWTPLTKEELRDFGL